MFGTGVDWSTKGVRIVCADQEVELLGLAPGAEKSQAEKPAVASAGVIQSCSGTRLGARLGCGALRLCVLIRRGKLKGIALGYLVR